MVLDARPAATVVALDLFAESFEQHFGADGTPQQRLLANLQAAGVDDRATIQPGDMLQLPFDDNEFDAVVSAYAIDHVGREGAERALNEAARVVKPGGDFLLMIVANDSWVQFAFGPLLMHGGPRGAEWWAEQVRAVGFEIVEQGTQPATIYLLARRE
jgi:ubiquinone/menaquinone biosynthesis C-methylase UbiE